MNHLVLTGYLWQIAVAELIFLLPADKRSHFRLRFAGLVCVITALGMLFPLSLFDRVLLQLFGFALLYGLNVLLMWMCFDVRLAVAQVLCVAGYAMQHITYHLCSLLEKTGLFEQLHFFGLNARHSLEIVFFPLIYLVFALTLGRYSAKTESYRYYDKRFHLVSVLTVFICIGLTRLAEVFGGAGSVIVSLYAITACMTALYVQMVLFRAVSLRTENEMLLRLWKEERRQYEISKKTIDTINIKYHDLKHRLRHMNLQQEEIESLKDTLKIYQSQFKTGNEALDVLLTENSLRCMDEGIQISFTGNGEDLSFMSVPDVYTFFGNAVDNAIEAAGQVAEKEKRLVDVSVERRGDMVNIRIVNYYAGEVDMKNGIPGTSKTQEEGFHGFGIRSMQLIAEKYGGHLSLSAERELFEVSAYMMRV